MPPQAHRPKPLSVSQKRRSFSAVRDSHATVLLIRRLVLRDQHNNHELRALTVGSPSLWNQRIQQRADSRCHTLSQGLERLELCRRWLMKSFIVRLIPVFATETLEVVGCWQLNKHNSVAPSPNLGGSARVNDIRPGV